MPGIRWSLAWLVKNLRLIQGLSTRVSKCPYSNFVPKQLERTPEYIGNFCAHPFRIFLIVSVHWIVNLRSPCKKEVVLEELWVIISYGYCDTLILLSYNLSFRKSRVDYWSSFFVVVGGGVRLKYSWFTKLSLRYITLWFTYYFFLIIFHYRLLQGIVYNSLCYAVNPCCLSILHIVVYTCYSHILICPSPSSSSLW